MMTATLGLLWISQAKPVFSSFRFGATAPVSMTVGRVAEIATADFAASISCPLPEVVQLHTADPPAELSTIRQTEGIRDDKRGDPTVDSPECFPTEASHCVTSEG